MTVNVYSLTGKVVSTLTLPDGVFSRAAKPALLAQAVRVYLSNQRQGTKSVKTRADVSYSTRKLWRQKGTGRARHGSRKAPIFVGGGVAHGPTGNENYTLKLTKKMRHLALYGALTAKAQDQAICILDDVSKSAGKTKAFQTLFSKITSYPKSRLLLVLDQPYPGVLKAVHNLPGVFPTQVKRLNAYEVLNHQSIVMVKPALDFLAGQVIISKPLKLKEKV